MSYRNQPWYRWTTSNWPHHASSTLAGSPAEGAPSVSNPLSSCGGLGGRKVLPQLILLDTFFSFYFISFLSPSSVRAKWPYWSQRWAFGPNNMFYSIPAEYVWESVKALVCSRWSGSFVHLVMHSWAVVSALPLTYHTRATGSWFTPEITAQPSLSAKLSFGRKKRSFFRKFYSDFSFYTREINLDFFFFFFLVNWLNFFIEPWKKKKKKKKSSQIWDI